MVLQLTAGGVERVADRDMHVLVPPRGPRIPGYIDVLAAGHGQMDADAVGVAFVVAMLGARDYDARRGNAVVEALEPLRLLGDRRLEGIGMTDVLEGDLERYLHGQTSREEQRSLYS